MATEAGRAETPDLTPPLRLTTSSGSIEITAEPRDDIEIATAEGVEHHPSSRADAIAVRPNDAVKVRCPSGFGVVVGTRSGSVRLIGSFGEVLVTTNSGSMLVDEVTSTDMRTTSGSVELRRCAGRCRATTTSGSVRVDAAGDADISVGSGTLRVTSDTARLRTVSGTVKLHAAGDASVQTVSGSVTIFLPKGVRPRVMAHGMKRPKINVDQGDDCEVSVRSVSGSITVQWQ